MKVLFIFEFGFPPYRKFLIEAVKQHFGNVKVIAGKDKFINPPKIKELNLLFSLGEIFFYRMNLEMIKSSDVIISSANIRRPHTWIGMFLYSNKKWILWGQGVGKNKSFLMRLLRNEIFKRSHRFVVYTQGGRDDLIEMGYPQERIIVANNTLLVSNNSLTSRGSYLLYVGRIQARKQIELIFPYLEKLNVRLRIVGSGVFKSKLMELAEIHRAWSYIEFFEGTQDEEELKTHFSGALAYFSPGHVGLGVVHAFSYGVPVITFPNRSHAPEFEYCNLGNSYLPQDEAELFASILAIQDDFETHELKCQNAYFTYLGQLSPKHMIKAFIEGIESD